MIFYSKDSRVLLDTEVEDNSYRHRAIMGDHNITFHYSLAEHVELPVGAYCVYGGERFTLERPEAFKMKHKRSFEYTVTMEGDECKAKKFKFRNTVDGRLKFVLTAKPHEHLQMFVDNMNRRDEGWTIGDCVDGTEIMISYNHNYCYEALTMMANELDTEFEFVGKKVSLHKVEYDKSNPLPLSYGRGNGFKSGVGRSNSGDKQPVEILFVQGGSDNIDRSTYGNGELLLPKNQMISYDGEFFETDSQYNPTHARKYIVDDKGLSIRRADKVIQTGSEDSLDASSIYPKREGIVTSVVTVDNENNFYDIVDNTIPETLDFNDCLIDGNKLTIIFQSGMLVTRKFEVTYFHDSVKGKAARRFELVPIEEDGMSMPSGDYLPAIGDRYAVFNCALPDSYICDNSTKTGAEWDMFKQAVKHLYESEDIQFTFTGELDGIWAKKSWENIGARIKLGGYVEFSDTQFQQDGVLVRIIGVKDYINNPHSPEIELSNQTITGGFSSTLNELKGTEVVAEEYHRDSIQFTKRRFRDARETINMLEDALLDKFTNSINPIAVQTMSMLVGDESLQFRFVDNKKNPSPVSCNITYNSETGQLNCGAGIMQHLTLGVSGISPQHDVSEYKFWDISDRIAIPTPTKKYYLYIKAERTTQNAEWTLSEKTIGMTDNGDYYHFLCGVLNSEYDGERSFVTLYGYSEILPGRITTDKIVSSEGTSYFDMVNNAMKLGKVFDFNSQGDGKLRLKGTLVQSQSGTESYLGCYRGVYNNSTTYFCGDEVTYTVDGLTSTYRYFNTSPYNGIVPTNTAYWNVVAKGAVGADGKDGTSVKILGTKNSTSELPTSGNTNGDGYIVGGDLYVWDGTQWNNVGKIHGNDGKDGTDGNYTELRFAANGSLTESPELNQTALNPLGWSSIMPTVGTAQYVWVTTAIKNGVGTQLISSWGTPVRITPYNGKDGADGKDGKSPAMLYRGVYDSTKTYYGNENRLDCVKYGNSYYIARIDAGVFNTPAPPDTSKWNDFGASFESVATNLLLAENANIAGFVFRNGRLESENGNMYLDGVNGKARLKGTMQLSTTISDAFTDANVVRLPEITYEHSYTCGNGKDEIGKVCKLFNSGSFGKANYKIFLNSFHGNDSTWVRSSSYSVYIRPQETIEITCFEKALVNATDTFSGSWEITNRFGYDNFTNGPLQGRFPRMLALGHVYGSNSQTASISGYFYNGKSIGSLFTISRIGEGEYKVSFASGLLGSVYWVVPWGYGYCRSETSDTKATIYEKASNYFIIHVSDDATRNDGNFEFMILASEWYYDLN